MNQRSFKLANTAERAKFWASGQQPPLPTEPNPDMVSNTEVFNKGQDTVVTLSSSLEDEQNINKETPKPRKAIPVKRTEAISPPDPALRPKPVLKPKSLQTERAPEKLVFTHPSSSEGLTAPSKRIEPKAAPFEERYERITTYLERPLFKQVHRLHESGEIAKIASLLNAAVKDYLHQHYPNV